MSLLGFHVADDPEVWHRVGFTVAGAVSRVDGLSLYLGAEGEGLVDWVLASSQRPISDLPTTLGEPRDLDPEDPVHPGEQVHPNGVTGLDHVVVRTDHLERTISAFESAGVRLRRTREINRGHRPGVQAFFRLGPTIVEVVGSLEADGQRPDRFFGLAFTVADLDQTAAMLGDLLRPAKPAVQPGRRVATLDRRAGSSVPMLFISPQPPRGP